MFLDLSVKVSPKILSNVARSGDQAVSYGHLGTHFDVMNKEFPLEFIRRNAVVFDVSNVANQDVEIQNVEINLVNEGMFVAFYTGFMEEEPYGTKEYFTNHPQLSDELIDALLNRKISIIGIDFAGVRRGREHALKDQYCADRGVFIVENLCNLKSVLNGQKTRLFTANTYPLNFSGMSGLPCRVVAEI